MTGKERMYFGLGLAAYAVAKADGKIDQEERNKLHEIVTTSINCHDEGINVSEIIFHVLGKHDNFEIENLYKLAIEELTEYKSYLSDDMRSDFPAILEKVARSRNPITPEENQLIERFRNDINYI
ncbi:MAG: hypothetical protein RJQ00_08140 [Vicingaceae bacterium]